MRIAWQDDRNGFDAGGDDPAARWNAYYRTSSDGGLVWSAESRLSTFVPGYAYKLPEGHLEPYGDYLELDIDLRLADLWREAGEIGEWNIEVVAAFMRAAYGKGYCDALTEDFPGSLCHAHGYKVPERREPVRER